MINYIKEQKIKSFLKSNNSYFDFELMRENKTISMDGVTRLHDWSVLITEVGNENEKISVVDVVGFEQRKVEIQEIYGLFSSKSNLSKFSSLHEFAEANCKHLIGDVSEAQLHKMLNWYQLPQNGELYSINQYYWDKNRKYFSNSGGSHHFAAACYIASKLRRPTFIDAKITKYGKNYSNLDKLTKNFKIYILKDLNIKLDDLLRQYPVKYSWYESPFKLINKHSSVLTCFNNTRLLFINRHHLKGNRLISFLDKMNLIDFGKRI